MITFLWSQGMNGSKNHWRLVLQYGESNSSGRTRVTQKEGVGKPSTSNTEVSIQQAPEMFTETVYHRRIRIVLKHQSRF